MAANRLLRKPTDPDSVELARPFVAGMYGRGYRPPAVAPAPVAAPPPPTVSAPAVPAYTPPAAGTVRGSAGFNAGLKGININEWGAGLWAQGVDVNSPNLARTVRAVYDAKLGSGAMADPDFQKRVAGEFAKKGWSASNDKQLIDTVDWYWRDLSRRMAKSNNFFDSTVGKIVGLGVTVAASIVGGPAGGAAAGAVTGGLKDGPLGALAGAVGGYGIGKGVQWVQGGGISNLFGKLTGAAPVTSTAGKAASSVVGGTPIVDGTVKGGKSLLAGLVPRSAGAALETAANVTNIGLGIRDLVKGAAVVGGAALAAGAMSTPDLKTSTEPTPAPAKTPVELQREKELKRRRAVSTNLTWGNALTAPMVNKPKLLGAPTKLVA